MEQIATTANWLNLKWKPNLFVGVFYFLGGQVGLLLHAPNTHAPLIWISTGIAVSAILKFGFSVIPGITFGAAAIVVSQFTPLDPFVFNFGVPLQILAGPMQAIVAVLLLQRSGIEELKFTTYSHLLPFLIYCVVLSPICSATLGVVGLMQNGLIQSGSFAVAWVNWWLADMLGILLVAPIVSSAIQLETFYLNTKTAIEFFTITIITLIAATLIFFDNSGNLAGGTHFFVYIIFPLIVWAGLRTKIIGAAVVSLLIAFMAVIGTAHSLGPFTFDQSLTNTNLNIFLIIISLTGLFLATTTSERNLFLDRQKKSSEELEEKVNKRTKEFCLSQERFKALYDDAPVMMHSINAQGFLINVNKQWLETLGYELDEVIGRKSIEFLTEASRKNAVETVLPRFFKTGITRSEPFQFLKKNGDIVDVLLSSTSEKNEAGEVIESRAVLINETEQLKAKAAQLISEEKLRDFAEISSDWFWEMNENLRFTNFSGRRQELVGLSADFGIGKTRWEVAEIDPEKSEKWKAHRDTLEAHQPFRDFEVHYEVDKLQQISSISGKPTFNTDGVFTGYRGTSTDISERKRGEGAIKKLNEELEKLVEDRTSELKESEKRFRDIAETTSDRFWEMDENFRFTLNIDASGRKYPISTERFIGHTRWEAAGVDPDKDEKWRRHREDHLAHRSYKNFEFAITSDDEKSLHLSVSGSAVFDNNGTFKGYRGSTLDITRRKEGEEALQKSEKVLKEAKDQLDSIISNLPGGIFRRVLRPDGTEYSEYYMGKLSEVLGLEARLGKGSARVISKFSLPEYRKVRDEAIRKSAEKMSPCIFEYPIKMPDGSTIWVQSVSLPHLRENGEIVWDGINLDITELKKAENRAKESESILSRSEKIANSGHFSWNFKTQEVFWSKQCFDIFGRDPDTWVPTGDNFRQDILPEDKKRLEDAHVNGIESGKAFVIEYRYYRGGFHDQIRWVLVSNDFIRDENGEITHMVGIVQDITDNKETQRANQRLASSINGLPDPFALYDADDRFVMCNDQYRNISAKIPEALQPGFPFEERLRLLVERGLIRDAVGKEEEWIKTRMEKHRNPSGPFEVVRADGQILLNNDQRTEDGSTAIIVTDITESRLVERQANEREKELARVRRLNVLGELGAAVAHELNQPLTVISLYAQGMEEKLRIGDVSPDDFLEPVKNLVNQSQRAGEIIRGLRALIDKREQKRTLVNLNASIEEVLTIIGPECEKLRTRIKVDLDEGVPQVMADETQIQQLLLNLANNSMEAMSEGPCASPRLTIRTFLTDDDNVEVAVEDTGPGFSSDGLETIFEPFFTTKTHGLGFGLSICRSITEANGGRIWVEPSPGKGAIIRFSLPIANEMQLKNA